MRLLLSFVLLSLALLAVFAVLLFLPGDREPAVPSMPPPAESATVASAPSTAPAVAAAQPAPPITLPDPPAPSPLASRPAIFQTPVRWAGEPDVRAAQRRLRLAEATLADDPEHPAALRDAVDACRTLGRWRDMTHYLHTLAGLSPEDRDLQFDYAAALLTLGRTVEALEPLREITAAQPDNARAWHNLAAAHQQLGHLSAAARAWTSVLDLEDSPAAHLHRGTVRLDLRDHAGAVQDFAAYLQAQPADHEARFNYALALQRSGQPDAAYVQLLRIVDANPQHLPTLRRLAELSMQQFKKSPADDTARAKAKLWCDRYLDLAPNDEEVSAWRKSL
jgi:tetratricopeptide (TPR) repeat protein